MPSFGPLELFLILAMIVLLFGIGRIANVGDEMGRAVTNFRKSIAANPDENTDADTE